MGISRTPWTWEVAKIQPGFTYPRCRILDATGEEIARLEPREAYPRQPAAGNAALMAGSPLLEVALQKIRAEAREALQAAAMGDKGPALLAALCGEVEKIALGAITAALFSQPANRGVDF